MAGGRKPMRHQESMPDLTRRDALKKAAYIAPLVLTLPAVPSFASAGSDKHKDADKHKDKDKPPKDKNKLPKVR
jgi:hypothetical protein